MNLGLAIFVFILFAGHSVLTEASQLRKDVRPNVIFILTDDQDLHMNSLNYLPYVKKHLTDQGTYFKKHYCTVAICCPSRVNLWTGRAAHNTNVTDVSMPYGGYPKIVQEKILDNYLFTWLEDAGYANYYVGKLFNQHTITNYDSPFPKGFTEHDFLLDPGTYQYYNSWFQRNNLPPANHKGEYQTDLVANKTYGFLDTAVGNGKPFLLVTAPTAPHANIANGAFGEPLPASRHETLFKDAIVPRTANFNPENPSGASWIKGLPRQNKTNVDYNDHFYRQRLRSLQAFDEMVDGLFERLERYGILENTYIIYTTDNGFHIGHHRMQPGKECGYEEDVNIPLIIRGPDVPKAKTANFVTSHTDLAPTILELIGSPTRPDFDGQAIPLTDHGIHEAEYNRQEHVNVEFWGNPIPEGIYGLETYPHTNHTFKSLRITGKSYNLYYSVWCTKEHELYNMKTDPHQLHNLYGADGNLCGVTVRKLTSRLDSLLLVLKSCKGDSCRYPWKTLHPEGNVQNLEDALNARYDTFYEGQPRVGFERCELGYILSAEGPQFQRDGKVFKQVAQTRWSDLVPIA